MDVGPRTEEVFLVILEVEPTLRCELVAPKVVGGYARCFVLERSETLAIVRTVDALRVADFEVMKVAWSGTATSAEAQTRYRFDAASVVRRVTATKCVHLDRLDTWTLEDLPDLDLE